mmetsp:Transcript_20558/g.48289  ORF Transcript_20558/g.48289 Transcript_20558/m.48289 type:complete len:154 (+) Transcript_20558:556-1017(+)
MIGRSPSNDSALHCQFILDSHGLQQSASRRRPLWYSVGVAEHLLLKIATSEIHFKIFSSQSSSRSSLPDTTIGLEISKPQGPPSTTVPFQFNRDRSWPSISCPLCCSFVLRRDAERKEVPIKSLKHFKLKETCAFPSQERSPFIQDQDNRGWG